MRKNTIGLFILMALACVGAYGQSDIDFPTISVSDFKLKLADALLTPSGADDDILVAGAFLSRRLDLVSTCYDTPGLGYINEHFRATPPSDFKNAVVLMILRRPWPFDDSINRMGGMPPEFSFMDTLREYVPEVATALTSNDLKTAMAAQKQFDSLAGRQKFADILEEAMTAKKLGGLPSDQGPSSNSSPPVAIPQLSVDNSRVLSPTSAIPSTTAASGPPSPVTASSTPVPVSEAPSPWKIIIGAFAILAAAAAFRFRRK